MRRRFFVERFDGSHATLSGDSAHHAGRVLRVAEGQLYELSDGRAVWLARVEAVKRDAVEFSLVEPVEVRAPALHITLLLAIVKFDRFEWAIEKATELGVSEITPLAASRSERALVAAATKRAARWQKILVESAQQCRRISTPLLHPPSRPADAFAGAFASNPGAVRLMLSEDPASPAIRSILEPRRPADQVALAIGPEGGWTEKERSQAHAAGFTEVSLGPTILRTETAVAAALAAVSYALETPQMS